MPVRVLNRHAARHENICEEDIARRALGIRADARVYEVFEAALQLVTAEAASGGEVGEARGQLPVVPRSDRSRSKYGRCTDMRPVRCQEGESKCCSTTAGPPRSASSSANTERRAACVDQRGVVIRHAEAFGRTDGEMSAALSI